MHNPGTLQCGLSLSIYSHFHFQFTLNFTVTLLSLSLSMSLSLFSARYLTHGTSPKFLLSSTASLGAPSTLNLSWHGTFTLFCTYCNHFLWVNRVAVTRHNKWVPAAWISCLGVVTPSACFLSPPCLHCAHTSLRVCPFTSVVHFSKGELTTAARADV